MNDSRAGLSQFVATHPAVIEAVEQRHAEIDEMEFGKAHHANVLSPTHPAIKGMLEEIQERFGLTEDEVCVLGSTSLKVFDEDCEAVRVTERDGLERPDAVYLDGLILDPDMVLQIALDPTP